MARIDLKFLDESLDENFIKVKALNDSLIKIEMGFLDYKDCFVNLDIPTAIRFAKTLRAEINKAKEINLPTENL